MLKIVNQAKLEYYTGAIQVELRLRGVDYVALEKDILYKNLPISSHHFDIVLPDKTVVCVGSYDKEEKIAEAMEDERGYFDLFGIKKGFFIGIPTGEGDKAVVKEM